MSLPTSSASRVPNIEAFLFADIGEQPNGLPLTVLSLLARAGLDPWAEAERLSRLSKSAAVSCMIAEISRAPTGYRSRTDVAELAKRLVAALPTHERIEPHVSLAGTGFEHIPTVPLIMIFYAALVLGLLTLLLAKT
jgi:hypothetical protein